MVAEIELKEVPDGKMTNAKPIDMNVNHMSPNLTYYEFLFLNFNFTDHKGKKEL